MSNWEKEHLIAACQFELGKVETIGIREKVVNLFNKIDHQLAAQVAEGIGIAVPAPVAIPGPVRTSPSLSQAIFPKNTISTRKIAFLAAPGFSGGQFDALSNALKAEGAIPHLVATVMGQVKSEGGANYEAKLTFNTTKSVVFDAVVVLGGKASVQKLSGLGNALSFVAEAYKHGKPIAALEEGVEIVESLRFPGIQLSDGDVVVDKGVVTTRKYLPSEKVEDQTLFKTLFTAIAAHRHYERDTSSVPVA